MENISALQFGMSGKNKEIHFKRKLLFNEIREFLFEGGPY
jgi:hypothetical protein